MSHNEFKTSEPTELQEASPMEKKLRRLAKIICPFLFSMCYDRLYAEPNKRGHCSKVYHLEAALG